MSNSLQKERLNYIPRVPPIFKSKNILCFNGKKVPYVTSEDTVKKYFPQNCFTEYLEFKHQTDVTSDHNDYVQRVGVLFSGGPAPGGHNVIWGLIDYLKKLNQKNELIGFLMGPRGLINNETISITESLIVPFKNQGGFDLLGTSRDNIFPENYSECLKTVNELKLTGLVNIGGDDSNTNTIELAEYFISNNCHCHVIGVPKTIDGDLRGNGLEISFGHDSCCKLYGELIGNLMADNLSTKKYYSFVRLMGRDASHITLELALMTHPNWCFIAEEIGEKQKGIKELTKQLADVILSRAKQGKNYGVFLLPEGMVNFMPEMQNLLSELNSKKPEELSRNSKEIFDYLPLEIQTELSLTRIDDHGDVQLSKIEIERLLSESVTKELQSLQTSGAYKMEFHALKHFYGYEGRCVSPTNFDCDYCFSLGCTAALLLQKKKSGYLACIRNVVKTTEHWEAFGLPIASMICEERRKGREKVVIKKALVDLDGNPFKELKENLQKWSIDDCYVYPGPLQYHGSYSESRAGHCQSVEK